MKITELYKKSFGAIFSIPSLTMILVLFLIASTLITKDVQTTSGISLILKTICLYLMSLCFASGWFYLFKNINTTKEKDEKNYYGLFLEGIGKNIIPFAIASIIYVFLFGIVTFLTIKFAHHTFGSLDFFLKDFMTIANDNNALIEYFNKLSVDEKYIIYAWQLTFIAVSAIFNFILLFYFPSIIYEEKFNMFLKPFVALKNCVVFVFKNFFGALLLYLSIYFAYVILNILKVFAMNYIILSILLLFVNIYFITFVVMLIFKYYEEKNNCNHGCDCIGQNENIDKSGEEN